VRHTTFGVMLVILGAILLLGVIVQDISLVLRFWPLLVVVYALLAHGLSPAYRGGLIVVALVLLADALAGRAGSQHSRPEPHGVLGAGADCCRLADYIQRNGARPAGKAGQGQNGRFCAESEEREVRGPG